MATYKLSYFTGKGLAEVIRMELAATGTPYEDFRYPIEFVPGQAPKYDLFLAAKPTFPMCQVPVLEVTIDGKTTALCQSKAIQRYIGRETGLMGANNLEAAQIDAVGELIADWKDKFNAAKGDDAKVDAYFKTLEAGLEMLSKNFIGVAGSGFCVGSKISIADIQLLHFAKQWFQAEKERAAAVFAASVHVTGVLANVEANEGIAKWLADAPARGDQF